MTRLKRYELGSNFAAFGTKPAYRVLIHHPCCVGIVVSDKSVVILFAFISLYNIDTLCILYDVLQLLDLWNRELSCNSALHERDVSCCGVSNLVSCWMYF